MFVYIFVLYIYLLLPSGCFTSRREKEILINNKFIECLNLKMCSRCLLQIKPKASCSLEHSWRAAGCLFLDNDLYVFSCEHTFPVSCCCFSRLDKKFLFMHRVFQNWFGFFFPSCSLLPPFEFIHITFPIFTSPPAPVPSPPLTPGFPFLSLLFFLQFDDFHFSSFPRIFGI